MYIKDFEIIIYPVECMFRAVANKNGDKVDFCLGEYSSQEKAQKIAPIRMQNLIDAQDSEFIMWANRKEDYFTILKQRDEAVKFHSDDIKFLEKWLKDIESKNWHQETAQEIKDTITQKRELIKSITESK